MKRLRFCPSHGVRRIRVFAGFSCFCEIGILRMVVVLAVLFASGHLARGFLKNMEGRSSQAFSAQSIGLLHSGMEMSPIPMHVTPKLVGDIPNGVGLAKHPQELSNDDRQTSIAYGQSMAILKSLPKEDQVRYSVDMAKIDAMLSNLAAGKPLSRDQTRLKKWSRALCLAAQTAKLQISEVEDWASDAKAKLWSEGSSSATADKSVQMRKEVDELQIVVHYEELQSRAAGEGIGIPYPEGDQNRPMSAMVHKLDGIYQKRKNRNYINILPIMNRVGQTTVWCSLEQAVKGAVIDRSNNKGGGTLQDAPAFKF